MNALVSSLKKAQAGLIAFASIAFLIAASGLPVCSAQEYKARLSYHWFPKHHAAIYANKFAEEVEKATEGELKIEIFHSGQLYGIREALTAVSSGSVEMAGVLDLNFAAVDKNFMISLLGYFWPSYDKLHGFWEDTPEGRAAIESIEKRLGVKLLCYDPVGPSCRFSTKEMTGKMEDLRGLKSRYLTAAEKPALKVLGIEGVSVSTGEMYTALKQGMVNTVMTNPSALKAYSWWDFLEYAEVPYESYIDTWIVANARWWNSLPDDVKKTIMEDVSPRISEEATNSVVDYSNSILDEFEKEQGGTVISMSEDEIARRKKLMEDTVWPVLSREMDSDFYKAAKEYMGYE